VAKEANLEKAMKKLFKNRNVAIQGEICGSKIQGNHYKFDTLKLFIFGVMILIHRNIILHMM